MGVFMELWELEEGTAGWKAWSRIPEILIKWPEEGYPTIEMKWSRKKVYDNGDVIEAELPVTLLAMNELSGEDATDALAIQKHLMNICKRRSKR